jgi:hypothetical protein
MAVLDAILQKLFVLLTLGFLGADAGVLSNHGFSVGSNPVE